MKLNTSERNGLLQIRQIFVLLIICLFLVYCTDPKSKTTTKQQTEKLTNVITALPVAVEAPKDNATTSEKVKLGKLLFYDPILSGNKDVACVTCHHPNTGYAEFLDISIGVNGNGLGSKRKFNKRNDIPFVKRNAQTILNTAFNGIRPYENYTPENAPMFWDHRTKSLELQALEPIKAFEEMRGHEFLEAEILQVVIDRLKKIPEYQKLFELAFGENDAINIDYLAKAIAAFERTLVTNNSRFDRYMRGDENAIHTSEKDGFEQFKKVGCVNCHNGPMFSDYKMHVLGVPENRKLNFLDVGVADVTAKDSFAFRTASLRNLRYTAPYMHNGSLNTLKEVLEFYEDISGNKMRNPNIATEQLDSLVGELKLTVKEMSQIISFLNTLNGDNFDRSIPASVPSGLPVGGNIQ